MIVGRLGLVGIVVVFLHGVIAVLVLVRRRSRDPAQAIVMALHALQHRRRRRIRQGDADQQDQEGAESFHETSLALSFSERNVEYGPELLKRLIFPLTHE